jgi:RNA polymerase sigma-70 factor (ECF subfamily)
MTDKSTMRDRINQAKEGDQEAFAEVYEHYFAPLYRYISFRIGNVAEAEDLTQSVFVRAYQNLERYQDQGYDPRAYFYAAARNAITDYYRASPRRAVEGSEEILAGLADGRTSAAAELDQKLLRNQVQSAIGKLEPGQQEVIILRFIEGLDGRSTAAIIGKSEVATRQLQARAIRNLQKILTGEESP